MYVSRVVMLVVHVADENEAGTRKYRMMIILLLLLVIQRMMIMPMAVAVLVMTKSDGIHRIVSYSTVLGFVVSQVMKQDDEVVLARCYKQTPEVPACSAAGAMAMKSFAVRGGSPTCNKTRRTLAVAVQS